MTDPSVDDMLIDEFDTKANVEEQVPKSTTTTLLYPTLNKSTTSTVAYPKLESLSINSSSTTASAKSGAYPSKVPSARSVIVASSTHQDNNNEDNNNNVSFSTLRSKFDKANGVVPKPNVPEYLWQPRRRAPPPPPPPQSSLPTSSSFEIDRRVPNPTKSASAVRKRSYPDNASLSRELFRSAFNSEPSIPRTSPRPKQRSQQQKQQNESLTFSTYTKKGHSRGTTVDLARLWKDVLVRAGISIEFAWKYALKLAEAKYDETNAETLTHTELAKIGMTNGNEREATLNTIQEIGEEMRQATAELSAEEEAGNGATSSPTEEVAAQRKHALTMWRNIFMKGKLGKEWGVSTTVKYSVALVDNGWDDWNIDSLNDGDLESAGISNPAHREIILQLVERELAEAELNPESAFAKVAVTKEELDHMKQVRAELAERIEAFEVFQTRISEILNGDTDTQREARAKREAARAIHKAEREQRRLDRIRASNKS